MGLAGHASTCGDVFDEGGTDRFAGERWSALAVPRRAASAWALSAMSREGSKSISWNTGRTPAMTPRSRGDHGRDIQLMPIANPRQDGSAGTDRLRHRELLDLEGRAINC